MQDFMQAEDGRHQRRLLHLTEERVQELENQLGNARRAQVILALVRVLSVLSNNCFAW